MEIHCAQSSHDDSDEFNNYRDPGNLLIAAPTTPSTFWRVSSARGFGTTRLTASAQHSRIMPVGGSKKKSKNPKSLKEKLDTKAKAKDHKAICSLVQEDVSTRWSASWRGLY